MASKEQVHFILIPFMCPGHLIPMADMARLIARHRATVTIVTSPNNAARIQSPVQRAANSGLSIKLIKLRFPSTEFGLPEGCESIDALPSIGLVRNFFLASKALQDTIVEVLKKTEPAPSCIVSDRMLAWTGSVAKSLGIPRVIFDGMSCFTLLLIHNLYLYKPYESVSDSSEPFVVPGVPGQIEFTRAQLPGIADEIEFTRAQLPEIRMMEKKTDTGDTKDDLLDKFKAAELSADGVMVNSFEELEPNYVKGYRTVVKNLWCVGPVSLSKSAKSDRGNKSSIDENHCLKWLDSRNPRSVLYVCFGSLCHLKGPQLIELALGLESSNCAFVWVIRKGDYSEELDKWFVEEKYEERVQDKGLIVRGWAPQVLILSHRSIMGFMTHCGWNSTLEGVAAGVPLITWPMFAEQFYNEKLIVHVIKTGVRVGAEKCVKWGEEKEEEILVKREEVKRAIERVMDEGEEGRERRIRANKLGDIAKAAVQEGGSSYRNMSLMIQHVQAIQKEKKHHS